MTQALVPVAATTALVRRERALLEFTPEQSLMIRNSFASGASEQEFHVLLEIAKAKRLNPLLGQIHFVKRWTQDRGEVWATQTGIDGFRSIAEDTGLYDGQDEPEYGYEDVLRGGEPVRLLTWAKVKVYRKDINRAFVGVAHFSEYVQLKSQKNGGGPTKMWAEKPHIMLAKCAEALAFRKAFPLDLGDIYTHDELPREEHADRVTRQLTDGKPLTEPAPEVDWPALLNATETREALDLLAPRLDKEVKNPAQRKTLSALFKQRWKDLGPPAEPAKGNADMTDAEKPPEERQPGWEG